MSIPILDQNTVLENLKKQNNKFFSQYKAFYSSWYGGIINSPELMLVPADDHMVHRGDGVFEAIKFKKRKIFLFDEHLKRLQISAKRISLVIPMSEVDLKQVIIETLRASRLDEGLVRLFVSRGPGNFSPNPYDSVKAQIYVTITELKSPDQMSYRDGVVIGRSQISVKESWMAQTKTCNYLPNVMMKKESVDRGLAFTVSYDRDNYLAESSTENIALIDRSGDFCFPKFDHILKGTTLVFVSQIAESMGIKIKQKNITEEDLLEAQEVFMIGTTLDILPVSRYENKIYTQKLDPNCISYRLLEELRRRQITDDWPSF